MIAWESIDLKGRTSGTIKTTCPACSETRTKKHEPCLSVNITKGAARCWHCDEISWRDAKEPKEEKVYALPPQDWRNFTKLSDALVKWFDGRGIRQQTLIECRIGEEKAYFPAVKKELNAIVFNYFDGDRLVNKKYRSGGKHFTQVKGAKKILYGLNDIIGESEAYIVEGEMDKLAMWEAGIKNCVSVPNGANDLNDIFDTCEQQINAIDKWIIAVDMDKPGQRLEAELIKRLGKHRCVRVKFKGNDANADLLSDVLAQSISDLHTYPVEGTHSTLDLSEGIFDLYHNGLPAPMKLKAGWASKMNDAWGIIPGQFTVWTGIPGHGKSNFVEWYVLNLINEHGLKASFYSPEHLPMKLHHAYLAEKVIGKPFQNDRKESKRMTAEELAGYVDWAKDKIYLTAPDGGTAPDWAWIMQTFKEQVFSYGIDIFVIDAFNKVKRNTDSIKEISEILSEISLFCQYHGVSVFLIAHPTKMKKGDQGKHEVPTLYDIKGSGDFADQAHNGAVVYRHYGMDDFDSYIEFQPLKLKFRHQGTIQNENTVQFKYNYVNGRFYDRFGFPDYDTILKEKTLFYNDDFDYENEPF